MSPEAVRGIPDLMNLCIIFFLRYREILGELWNSAVLKASLARFIIVFKF